MFVFVKFSLRATSRALQFAKDRNRLFQLVYTWGDAKVRSWPASRNAAHPVLLSATASLLWLRHPRPSHLIRFAYSRSRNSGSFGGAH